jgi:uncharacterized protein (TIGR02145 family)
MKKTIISLFALVFIYSCTPHDTPITFTDSRDGKVYKTVTIGEQVWLAENLAYLPSVVGPGTGSEDTGHETDPYYYVYGSYSINAATAIATANYRIYGVLYNWRAALAACPSGWHLPNDAEWTQLETYLSNNGHNYDGSIGGVDVRSKIAKSMAAVSGWPLSINDGAVGNTDYQTYRNKSGFSALPGGYRNFNGTFYSIGDLGYWWSSTGSSIDFALCRNQSYNNSYVSRSNGYKDYGYSVRCVKD